MSKGDDALRRKWISHWNGIYEAIDAGLKSLPSLPEDLWNLRCGAKTRAGAPCKMKVLYRSGRCKLHGGLSTGPKSEEGKAKSARNGLFSRVAVEPHEEVDKVEVEEPVVLEMPPFPLPSPPFKAPVSTVRVSGTNPNDSMTSSTVRCLDCSHMSAGHTCILGVASGLPMGAIRECPSFSVTICA